MKQPPKTVKLNLLSFNSNAKTSKSDKESDKYFTAILYLAPFNLSGFQVCPNAERAKCHEGCLNSAGRGAFSNVQKARIRKTREYMTYKKDFLNTLQKDLDKFAVFCAKHNRKPCVRLNGTSDLNWLKFIQKNSNVQFYDYTKKTNDLFLSKATKLKNYSLTLSYSEANKQYAQEVKEQAIKYGLNVAVVVLNEQAKSEFLGLIDLKLGRDSMNFLDGDKTDLRFLDRKNSIVFLSAKGKAKKDLTGFVFRGFAMR